jgi:polyphosphate:AMP phosphotransferase
MFESAELGHEVDKETYEKEEPKLRAELLQVQLRIVEERRFPVIILSGGVDGGGKGATVNLLNEWMDPRHIQTHAMGEPTDEELQRPPLWRFWRALPPKGKLGIFFGSWYTAPIVDRVYGRIKGSAFEERLEEVVRFERMLADEGALLVKLWFHLSKKKQRKRFKQLEGDPAARWRVTKEDWENHEHYDRFRTVSERALRHTSTGHAPWWVVEAFDERYRSLTVGKILLEAMKKRLETAPATGRAAAALPTVKALDGKNVLAALDLTVSLDDKAYEKQLAKEQRRLNDLSREPRFQKMAVVAVFEGNDAAGKGGAIRRVTRALDARQYNVIPIAAPTEEERAQPYLWRFWRHVPRRGKLAIFDRSWYGRVLVERVEGFATPDAWGRAYGEIDDFEERLDEHGIVVVKFWLSIGKKVQLARFKEREATGFKQFKITDEDWRNRSKWGDYERAACEMIERTSTDIAPWHLVEANDKRWARVKVLRTLCDRIEEALGRRRGKR